MLGQMLILHGQICLPLCRGQFLEIETNPLLLSDDLKRCLLQLFMRVRHRRVFVSEVGLLELLKIVLVVALGRSAGYWNSKPVSGRRVIILDVLQQFDVLLALWVDLTWFY